MGGGGWEGVQKRGTYVYLRFIHIVVWQKSKHIFKAIICQLNFFLIMKGITQVKIFQFYISFLKSNLLQYTII